MISTYRQDFNNPDITLPPVQHYQEPCFTFKEGLLNQRCFPFAFPSFPSRKRESNIPIAAGFETLIHRSQPVQLDVPKSVKTQSERYNDAPMTEISDEVPQIVFEELINLATYTPSSKLPLFRPLQPRLQATKSNKPPSLLETQRLVKNLNYKAKKYHDEPGLWQKIGCVWDKVQERQSAGINEDRHSSRLLSRPRIEKPWVHKEEKQPNEFTSNIPGYGGYQARLPHVVKKEVQEKSPLVSSSRKEYRKYPAITYSLPKAGHQGPLSRTVTLTQPCNPFNKVTKHRITVK